VQETWPELIRKEMQPLSKLVLYRTPTRWRYAVYAGGVMDGFLADIAVDATEAQAQAALVRLVTQGFGRPIMAEWTPTQTDWWEAEATFAD
jgi:hypothetical protein